MDRGPSLDPIEVARLLVGLFLSQQVAAVVGPYAIIILAAMGGAAFRLADAPATGRYGAFFFFFWRTIAAVLLTVPVANMIAARDATWEAQWFFVPAAAGLAYTADRLKGLAVAAVEGAKSLIRGWVGHKPPGPGAQ